VRVKKLGVKPSYQLKKTPKRQGTFSNVVVFEGTHRDKVETPLTPEKIPGKRKQETKPHSQKQRAGKNTRPQNK